MVNRQSARGAQCSIRGAIVLALIALPTIATAQSGKGFLFKEPNGSFTIRAGYQRANTSSEPFTVLQRETTVGPRSFDAFNLALDLGFVVTRRLDLVFSLDASSRTNTAEYREWEENGSPITHESTLDRGALGAGLRFNLVDRGRQISTLAFIPAKTIPYIGVSGGMMWYTFQQKGDFVEEVDESTGNIFSDELRSSDYTLMGQAYAGIERRLNARWSLIGEARWTQASAQLNKDYAGLGDIQLSGLALDLGATVRF